MLKMNQIQCDDIFHEYMYHGKCHRSNCREHHLRMRFPYVDSHAHLDELIFGNFYGRRYEFDYNGFDIPPNYIGVVANLVFPQHFKHTSDVLNLSSNIYGTVELHPKYSNMLDDNIKAIVHSLLKLPKIKAVGEIGLCKQYLHKGVSEGCQLTNLRWQLETAKLCWLPVVFHCRDMNNLMFSEATWHLPREYPIHLHCFIGTQENAMQWMGGFPNLKFGIANLINKPNIIDVLESGRSLPLDKIVLETDCHHCVPPGDKELFSNPGHALNVALTVARLHNISINEVLQKTTTNCEAIYKFDFSSN